MGLRSSWCVFRPLPFSGKFDAPQRDVRPIMFELRATPYQRATWLSERVLCNVGLVGHLKEHQFHSYAGEDCIVGSVRFEGSFGVFASWLLDVKRWICLEV